MSLIGLAQNLDRIVGREYPMLNIAIVSEIKKVLFRNDKDKFIAYFDQNKSRIMKYPIIYKSILKEIDINNT